MELRIRAANPHDADLLSALGTKTFYDTFASFHDEEDIQLYLKKAYNPELIAQNLSNKDIAYFIVSDDDTAIGYTKLLLDAQHPLLKNKSVELEKIYVLENYLGKKAGKYLMNHALTYAKQEGYKTLFLGVWQENHRAVNFYKKAGFDIFDTRNFQLGKSLCDDFMMKIELVADLS